MQRNQLLEQQLLQEIDKIIKKIDSLMDYIFKTSNLFVSGTPIQIIERLKNTNTRIQEITKMLPTILQSYLITPTIGQTLEEDNQKIILLLQKQNYKAKLLDQNLEEMHNQAMNYIDEKQVPAQLGLLENKKMQYNNLIDDMLSSLK